jgi:hypothetical protein
MQLDGSSDDEDHKSPKSDSPQSAIEPNSFFKMSFEQLLSVNKFGGDSRVYDAIKRQLVACIK